MVRGRSDYLVGRHIERKGDAQQRALTQAAGATEDGS